MVFARKVVSALSVLAAHILSPAEPSEDGLRLLEYLKLGLRAQTAGNAGDAETAAVCISAVSGALVNYKVCGNYIPLTFTGSRLCLCSEVNLNLVWYLMPVQSCTL